MDATVEQEENITLSLDPVVDEALKSVLRIGFIIIYADLPIYRSPGRSRL